VLATSVAVRRLHVAKTQTLGSNSNRIIVVDKRLFVGLFPCKKAMRLADPQSTASYQLLKSNLYLQK